MMFIFVIVIHFPAIVNNSPALDIFCPGQFVGDSHDHRKWRHLARWHLNYYYRKLFINSRTATIRIQSAGDWKNETGSFRPVKEAKILHGGVDEQRRHC